MELKRRQFVKLLLAAVAATATAGFGLLRQAAPRRILQAVRARRYPGPLRPRNEARVRNPAEWSG